MDFLKLFVNFSYRHIKSFCVTWLCQGHLAMSVVLFVVQAGLMAVFLALNGLKVFILAKISILLIEEMYEIEEP